MAEAVKVIDGGKDIVVDDVLGDKHVDILTDSVLESVALELLAELLHNDAANLFLDAELCRVKVHIAGNVHHAVGENAHGLAVDIEENVDNTGVGNFACLVAADDIAGVGKNFAREGVCHRSCQLKARDAREEGELLVELIAADVGYLIAAAVKEQTIEQGLRGLDRGRIARTQLAVNFKQALIAGVAGVLVESGDDTLVLAEDLLDALIGGDADEGILHAAEPGGGAVLVVSAHGLDEPGDGELAVLVYTDIEHVVCVGLVLQPCAVVRDDRCGVGVYHGLVGGLVKVNAGGTDDLGNNNALGTVDDEGAAVGHEREVAHEDLLFLDLLRLLIAQTNPDLEGGGVRGVSRLALLLVVLRLLVHGVVNKAQLQIAGVVSYGINILKDLSQTRFQKPLVGTLLDFQQIGHLPDLLGAGKAFSQSLAVEDIFWHWRTLLISNCKRPAVLSDSLQPVLI